MQNKGKFGLLIALGLIMAGVTLSLIVVYVKMETSKAARQARDAAAAEFQKKLEEEKQNAKAVSLDTWNDVLVARSEIKPGSEVTPEMLEVKKFPPDVVPPEAFTKPEDITDLMPVHYIPAGDVLMPSKLRKKEEIGRASFLVTKGKRYLTMRLEPQAQGVGGMLRIGDLVDVLATYGEGEAAVSKIIIQTSRVIDVVNGDMPATQGETQAENMRPRLGQGDTVTFEVSPEEAELFKALEASGLTFKFILRNIQDQAIVETTGKRTADVIAAINPQEPKAAPPEPVATPAAPPPKRRVY